MFETSTIIGHLAAFHPDPVLLILADAKTAVPVRMLARMFNNHAMNPMQAIVADARRPEGKRDAHGVAQAWTVLDTICAWPNLTDMP